VADQQVARRGIEVRLSRAEQKAERASSRLRTLREDAMQAAHGMVRVSLLFGQLADEVERALEQAVERAIEQAAAETGKPRAAAQSQLPPPDDRWKTTLGELRTMVETEYRAASDANSSAHEQLQLFKANVSRLEDQIFTLHAAHTASWVSESIQNGGLARASSTQHGVGQSDVESELVGRGDGVTSAVATQSSAVSAPGSKAGLQNMKTNVTDRTMSESPITAAGMGAVFHKKESDGLSPASSSSENHVQVHNPPATNPCTGKRCPVHYEMVDRGDRCTCRPATVLPGAS